jgi:hypothetical protein
MIVVWQKVRTFLTRYHVFYTKMLIYIEDVLVNKKNKGKYVYHNSKPVFDKLNG